MQSKTSKSFRSPVLGFAKAQMHSFLFSALIFTIIMVAISFVSGSNPLYGYAVRDISYHDGNSLNFALTIAGAAFIFAAFTFKPFMAKNESDTFLSLPIKKSNMLIFQIVFGLVCILFSSLLSFGIIYPALNLTRFADTAIYGASIASIFTEIVIPMFSYYLLSVVLILKTRNFWSSLLLIAAFSAICFYSGSYINANVGMNAMGVDQFEITSSSQTFYFNSALFLPTKFILTILKLFLPLGRSVVDPILLSNIVNILLALVMFAAFVLASRKVVLGELNRPFAFAPLIKTLPIALAVAALSFFYQSLPELWIYILAAISFIVAAVLIVVFIKKAKKRILNIVAAALVTLLPLSCLVMNQPYSEKLTYELPSLSSIECVYFNPVFPTTVDKLVEDTARGDIVPAVRYCFKSPDAIEKILNYNRTIVENIKSENLMYIENMPVTEGLIVNPADTLSFFEDDYQLLRDEQTAAEEEQEQKTMWGMFDSQNVTDDYWVELFDYNSTIEITPNRSLPISGDDITDYMAQEVPKYTATFYYKLKDGRWIYRMYNPLPLSWGDTSVLQTDEYKERLEQAQ